MDNNRVFLRNLLSHLYYLGRESGWNNYAWEVGEGDINSKFFLENMENCAKQYDISSYSNNIFDYMYEDESKSDFDENNICILQDRMGAYIEGEIFEEIVKIVEEKCCSE